MTGIADVGVVGGDRGAAGAEVATDDAVGELGGEVVEVNLVSRRRRRRKVDGSGGGGGGGGGSQKGVEESVEEEEREKGGGEGGLEEGPAGHL